MIKDPQAVAEMELERMRQTPRDFERNLAIFESMLELARSLGKMPVLDPWYGIEHKIRLAKALNEITAEGPGNRP